MLERSENVEKWLRQATGQFKIHWQGAHLYEPDFVVETTDTIYIVEINDGRRTGDDEVKAKQRLQGHIAKMSTRFSLEQAENRGSICCYSTARYSGQARLRTWSERSSGGVLSK